MTRVSLEEQYDNKDVITQILKMRDDIARIAANAAGIQDITLTTTATGWKFTFTLTDGTSYVFPMDATGYVTDGELATALADYYTKTEIDNAFADYYTKTEMDTALGAKADDNAVVKLTGPQTVDGTKTFNDSPTVPDTPATEHSAVAQTWAENVAYNDDTVNNLLHKEGNENITGTKTFQTRIKCKSSTIDVTNPPTTGGVVSRIESLDLNDVSMNEMYYRCNTGSSAFFIRVTSLDRTVNAYLVLRVAADNSITVELQKETGGVYTGTTIASL